MSLIDDVIKEEVQQVDVEKIELPENQSFMAGLQGENGVNSEENNDETAVNDNVKMSLADLTNSLIAVYNGVSVFIYKKFEAGFDASLSNEEVEMLKLPLKNTLKQYNIEMSPVASLIMVVVSINIGKIMQLQMYRKMMSAINKEAVPVEVKKVVETVTTPVVEKVVETVKEKVNSKKNART